MRDRTREANVTRREFLVGTGVVVAAGLMGTPAGQAHAAATVGQAAPPFSATASSGGRVQLADHLGKVVVLEWTNHDCPYVRKHYESGNIQALQKDATGKGVAWLTVISSAPGTQGYVTAAQANELTAKRQAVPTAVLFDPEGTVGKLYKATVTPHMYVIDAQGVLVYAGAIDDRPTTRQADIQGAQNYVRIALDAVLAGQAVKTPLTRAYGCTIKYA
jgi:peroxiredoxin